MAGRRHATAVGVRQARCQAAFRAGADTHPLRAHPDFPARMHAIAIRVGAIDLGRTLKDIDFKAKLAHQQGLFAPAD